MFNWLRKLSHKQYEAVCMIDEGEGEVVVLLHGLASTGEEWRETAEMLKVNHRVLALDLLGFGSAPKPTSISYSAEDHAQAVLAVLKKRHVRTPVILVGHSMGCLVAVHLASTQPGLVKQLVLHEMPLYIDNPNLRIHAMMQRGYFLLYNRVVKHPDYSPANALMVQKLAARIAGFEITKQTWTPFVRTLKNVVMNQTAENDIAQLEIPINVIFGTRDIVVRKKMVEAAFGKAAANITTYRVQTHHTISHEASECIRDIVDGLPTKDIYEKPRKAKKAKRHSRRTSR